MKKSILFLMPALLLVTSCGPSKDNSSQDGTSQGGSSNESTSVAPSSSEERKLVVYFFTSYDFFDKENPHDRQEVSYGSKLTKPTDPDCPNEAYPTFLGWSEHPVVDEDRFIIDFSTYTVTTNTKILELNLYGIWVCE